MPSIRFDQVDVVFDGVTAVRGLSVELTEHRVALIGGNGSGKSTIARLINGLVTPSHGSVWVDELNVARNGAAVRAQVGFVFTHPDSQIIMPTVREDVAFSLRRLKLGRDEERQRTETLLREAGLIELADRPAHKLSGGQKQLLALTSVLATEPSLLVADEPTTLLDARNTQLMSDRFAALPQQLVLITHQLESVREFDRVLVIDQGAVVADDEPDAAVAFYRDLVARP